MEQGEGKEGGTNTLEIICARDAWRWQIPRDVWDGLQCIDHVVDGPSDSRQVVGVTIREGLDDHVQRLADGSTPTRDGTTSEVEGEGHGVAIRYAVGAFDTGGPLHLSVDSVGTFDHFPHHWANVGCGLGQRSGSIVQVA